LASRITTDDKTTRIKKTKDFQPHFFALTYVSRKSMLFSCHDPGHPKDPTFIESSTMPKNKRLKIAVLIKRFIPTGGAERYALEVTRRLAPDHDIHVFAQEWSFQGKEKVTFHKIPRYVRKPTWLNQSLFSHRSRGQTGNGFDIIHSHEKVTCFDVMTIHSPCFRSHLYQEKSRWKRSLSWLSLPFSPRRLAWLRLEAKQFAYHPEKLFVAVSENVKRDVQANYSLPDDSFHIAHPGVDTGMKQRLAGGAGRKNLRLKFNISQEEVVFLFVGTEFKRKGMDFLIQGLALLEPPRPRLLVAGGGGGKMERYMNLTRKLGLTEEVVFLGLVENIEQLYVLADALVLPTLSDPWGMAPIEAMVYGMPAAISSSRYCGAAEYIKNNEALLIKEPRDPQEIAQTLRQLMDPGLRAALSQKGQAFAADLTWEKTTANTLSAYHEVLRRKGKV
jgi:glycosyltransferase involved in cell wall biosynthesis